MTTRGRQWLWVSKLQRSQTLRHFPRLSEVIDSIYPGILAGGVQTDVYTDSSELFPLREYASNSVRSLSFNQ